MQEDSCLEYRQASLNMDPKLLLRSLKTSTCIIVYAEELKVVDGNIYITKS